MDKKIYALPALLFIVAVIFFPIRKGLSQPADQEYRLQVPGNDTAHIKHLLKQANDLVMTVPDSGVSIYRRALHLSMESAYQKGIARSLYGLGVYHSIREEYDHCISYYTQAMKYARPEQSLRHIVTSSLFNIGEAFYRKGNYGLSAYYFYQVLGRTSQMQDTASKKNVLKSCNRLAAIWENLKVPEHALYYANMQESLAKRGKDTLAWATALSTKGTLYCNKEEYEQALQYYANALKFEKSLGGRSNISNQQVIINNIANIHIRQGNIAEGIQYAEEALQLSLDHKIFLGSISARSTLGDAYRRSGMYKKAEQYLEAALHDARANGVNDKAAFIHLNLANTYSATRHYHKALTHLYQYVNAQDSFRGKRNAEAAGILETKYRTSEKDRQLAEKQVELLQQQSKIHTKNTWIAGISAGALLLSVTLVTLYRNNRHKQRLQQSQIHMLRQEQELIRLRAMMNGEEKERARIARELHDGIGGMLAAIKMNMDTVQEEDIHKDKTKLHKLMRMVEETTTEVRKTAHNLMPDILTRHNLEQALQIYCERINAGEGLQVQLRLYGPLSGIDKHIELTLYRIIQELTKNIIKHAHATEAVIELSRAQEIINITVEDNGQGFNPEINNNGFGLQNLRYRVQALRGELSIESAPGIGTTILIEFDLNKLHHTFAT